MRRRTNRQQRIDAFIKGFTCKQNKQEKKKKKRYPRDESLYNQIQENEFNFFLTWMPIVCRLVEDKYQRVWDAEYSLYEILVCLCIKRYFHLSLRRSTGVISYIVKKEGMNVRVPCFKTLDIYMNDPLVGTCITEVIQLTSNPTRLIETCFATDATGVATFCFTTWLMFRLKRRVKKKEHMMAHVTTGVKTKIVTAVDVDCKQGKDNVYFRRHVEITAENFGIKEWSGDSTYASRDNCDKVVEHGGKPYFKLKDSFTSKARGSIAWARMVDEAVNNKEEYDKHYHRRSNGESTFSAKKRKFGNFVRSRNETAKENEELFGWSCYNFTALARAYYEYDVDLDFER